MSIVPCRRAEGTPYSSVNEQICTVPVYRWRPRSSSDLSFCSSLSYLSLSFSGSGLYHLAARTAPSTCNSWHNLVECIMSTLNLGLQSVGLMRKAESESFEESAARCNSLTDLCKVGDRSQSSLQKLLILEPK